MCLNKRTAVDRQLTTVNTDSLLLHKCRPEQGRDFPVVRRPWSVVL